MRRTGGRTPASVPAAQVRAGEVVAEMHDAVRAAVRPGVTTAELDAVAAAVLVRHGATSNFLGYHGYPATICTSPNEVVVHGIPGSRVLAAGDLVSIDCGAIVDGWHADAAFSMFVGEPPTPEARRLLDAADAALAAAIAEMVPGARLGDVGAAVEEVALAAGFEVIEGYGGHGIGRAMHEAPDVPNHGRRGKGMVLRPGHVLCVEPMLAGTWDTETLDDGWTVVTADGSWAAHTEHTIAITDDGPRVLTAR